MGDIRIAILSDIHGNLAAFQSIMEQLGRIEMAGNRIDGYVLLGDLIDYGPHSNEIIQQIKGLDKPIICSIWGNHEKAIMEEAYDFFSSERGRASAKFTEKQMTEDSRAYLMSDMEKTGRKEFMIGDKLCLAIHGSIEDPYWKSIFPNQNLRDYEKYDYVFSGHSHQPHFFEKYYAVEDALHRNRKKTIFVNPGSVGQPRNLNHMAQFAMLDTYTEELQFLKVPYDIEREIHAFSSKVDSFYKDRLRVGV